MLSHLLCDVMDPPRQGKLDHQSTDLATRSHDQHYQALGRERPRISYFQLGAGLLAQPGIQPLPHHFVPSPYRFVFRRPLGVSQPYSIEVLVLRNSKRVHHLVTKVVQ